MYGFETYLEAYGMIGVALIVSFGLSTVLFGASYLLTVKNADVEKVSAYECGFDPFGDARNTFDVRFYLVAILFLLFDLEVSYLFPWSVTLGSLPTFGYWSMFIFLLILTIGFVYEWRKGGLEWE
uniref:NADH-ubiquinone oxidoreductase chain 3 n=1 Tax=Hemiarma marina TaxID=1848298 RepID=A0A679EJP8_9CRYP|nr:NADH dehydrogenase subunit 3 [Hemiarma marina]